MEVVGRVQVDLPEGAIESHALAELAISDDGLAGLRDGLKEERVDVELAPNDAARARLEETGLAELGAQLLCGQVVGRQVELVDSRRIEDESRLELAEMKLREAESLAAQTATPVSNLPKYVMAAVVSVAALVVAKIFLG